MVLCPRFFDKALLEPTFCEMYAELARSLSASAVQKGGLPTFPIHEDTPTGKPVLYSIRRALVIKCRLEYEQGQRALTAESNSHSDQRDKSKGTIAPSHTELAEAKYECLPNESLKARRRALGNIHFMGHLYRHGLLTRKIISDCVSSLLRNTRNPEPEDVEAMCKLMTTVGKDLENPFRAAYTNSETYECASRQSFLEMNVFIRKVDELRRNTKLDGRLRFMCQDLLDLRENHWETRRKPDGPKRIEVIHREAFREMAKCGHSESSNLVSNLVGFHR